MIKNAVLHELSNLSVYDGIIYCFPISEYANFIKSKVTITLHNLSESIENEC